MLAFTWHNGNLCMHVNPSSTIQMDEWICRYTPFWIQRGESYQKGTLKTGKVDVEQNFDSGKDKSCLTAERTTTRAPPRDSSSLPKSSWEAVGAFDAPSWKHTGTHENTVSWGSLGAQPPLKARVRHDPSEAIWHVSQKISPTTL